MRKALLFVIVVAMVATGLWLFVAGLFFESETNIWYVVSGGWLIGLGGAGCGGTSSRPSWARRSLNDTRATRPAHRRQHRQAPGAVAVGS
jgi:hypothetical protein